MCAFVVLDLVSAVLCQEIGYEERLRNDPFCVTWDVKPLLSQSTCFLTSQRSTSCLVIQQKLILDAGSSYAVAYYINTCSVLMK